MENKIGAASFIRYLKEKRSLWLIASALLLGIALMLFGNAEDPGAVTTSEAQGSSFHLEELEARVKLLCERVTGVSDASVMIMLDTWGEQQYASDRQITQSGDRWEERTEFVTASQGLFPTSEVLPKIRGVAVVCSRGDEATIQFKLTELLCALFGISASAVRIAGAAG